MASERTFLGGNLLKTLESKLFGVKDPAVLLDVLFLGLIRIEQRADAAYSVSGNNDFTDRLMSWDQDTCGQIGVFIIIILIFPEAWVKLLPLSPSSSSPLTPKPSRPSAP